MPTNNSSTTNAAVKNFEMIFNNTNILLEKYKQQNASLEKQNSQIIEAYERKLKVNESTIDALTKSVTQMSTTIKKLTDKITVLNVEVDNNQLETVEKQDEENQAEHQMIM